MKAVIGLVLVVGLSYLLGQWINFDAKRNDDVIVYSSLCNPVKQACEFKLNHDLFDIKFVNKPSGLKPFIVLVNTNENIVDSIELIFEMKGMDMGYNIHKMVDNKSTWHADVILPVCSLGRNDWVLNVHIKMENQEYLTVFNFNQ